MDINWIVGLLDTLLDPKGSAVDRLKNCTLYIDSWYRDLILNLVSGVETHAKPYLREYVKMWLWWINACIERVVEVYLSGGWSFICAACLFAPQSPAQTVPDQLYRHTLHKSVASSVIRSNLGFMADLITTGDQYEFQAQQTERERRRRCIGEWSGRYQSYFIGGHRDSRHSANDCFQNRSSDIRRCWQEMKALMMERH